VSVSLDQVVTGLGLLGNVLSLPNQVQAQQQQNAQTQALLKDSGIPDEMIKAATPEPMLRWLSPQQGGFTGHLLGGVGDVGSILSSVVGKPVAAPRMQLSDLAEASKLRVAHQQGLAKDELGRVIMDPKSTKRDIASAAIKAGSTDQALRLMRGGDEQRPPASILGLRSTLESMDPDDPRRAGYQRALDAQLAADKQRRDEENQAILDRQPPHYTPEETERRRHDQIIADRQVDAKRLGLKEGTPEYNYHMAHGYPPQAPREKAEPTYEEDFAAEVRRRDALGRSPLTMDQVPSEPVEDTVRRTRAARAAGKAGEKAGTPVPPPAPTVGERDAAAKAAAAKAAADKAAADQAAAAQGPGLGTRLYRGLFGGPAAAGPQGGTPDTSTTQTPTTGATTTSTTQPPGGDSDEQALAILRTIDFDSLPKETQAQVTAARDAGMPLWPLANWLVSLQPPQPGPPAPPR
jgi:hypothetical protein